MRRRAITRCTVRSPRMQAELTLAVASDLHNGPYADVLPYLKQVDAILIPGDLMNRHRSGYDQAAAFLRDAARCAPTFYALGNHEWKSADRPAFWPLVEQSGVTVLDNRWVPFRGLVLGGLSSAPRHAIRTDWLAEMAAQPGFRLLMCHQPEWFAPYVRPYGLDLTVSGHAHGGQVQLLGHGLYAPGQGLLPALTNGFYENGRLLVSRGMTNSSGAPRWGNPCEMILLRLMPGEEDSYAM